MILCYVYYTVYLLKQSDTLKRHWAFGPAGPVVTACHSASLQVSDRRKAGAISWLLMHMQ